MASNGQLPDSALCIEWTGARHASGYGAATRPRAEARATGLPRTTHAHRIAWEAVNGPVPAGCEVHHECGNPICVNVSHLRVMTVAEHRALHGALVTHCRHGHPYTEENTARYNGRRSCKACRRESIRRRREHERTATR